MNDYHAPLQDMTFVLSHLADLDAILALPGNEEVDADLVDAILVEADKFAQGVLAPINVIGDREGARWREGEVATPPGWRDAYAAFTDGGWNGLSCKVEHGGQGLPLLVSTLVEEMWNGANMAFTLCPMLTRGAIEAIELCGSDAQKAIYLERLVHGEWTGTMNLTEPQAGSDLAAVRTRAVPQEDGSYLITGQKIFITYGDHDLTDNIVHLVLARTPGAPEGVKGISLFLVPKFLVEADGRPGRRNDVRCASIEHKLGIHGSPTAVLSFGEAGGARGWLVGELHRGLSYMFTMMNAARFAVGVEGIGLCERAYQRALAYARDRVQGAAVGGDGSKVTIIHHPDVRRMLMQMKSRTEALRAVACVVAASMDLARVHPDAERRSQEQSFVDLMIPIVKGWSTETAVLVTSLGVQIHGGMGFIEEGGAAQHFRDARITPIYEGTTGIQAADLIGRKVARDHGAAIGALMRRMRELQAKLAGDDALDAIDAGLAAGVDALGQGVDFLLAQRTDPRLASASAVPFLELFGIVAGGWQMAAAAFQARRLLRLQAGDEVFLHAKLATARFYADHVLSAAPGLAHIVTAGAPSVQALDEAQF